MKALCPYSSPPRPKKQNITVTKESLWRFSRTEDVTSIARLREMMIMMMIYDGKK